MQNVDPNELAYLGAQQGTVRRLLLYMTARDPSDNSLQSIGFWNGDETQIFTINGENRTYHAAGAALEFEDLEVVPGFEVQHMKVQLVAAHPMVLAAFRQYDPRLAPAEIHSAVFDLDSRNLIAEPRRIFKGEINKSDIPRGPKDSPATVSVELVSSARSLTKTLPLYKSYAAHQANAPGDTFRKDAAIAGDLTLFWGSVRLETKKTAPASKPSGETGTKHEGGNGGVGHPYGR